MKFNETQKDFSINYPQNSKWVQVFKSGPIYLSIYLRDEITDLDKSQKNSTA